MALFRFYAEIPIILGIMSDEEQIATEGLDLLGYEPKWEAAKAFAARNQLTEDLCLLPFWERARVVFLTLGGRLKKA